MNAVEVFQSAVGRPIQQLSNSELAALMDACLVLRSIDAQCEREIESRVLAGQEVDGWELAPGRPSSAIMDPAAAFRILEPILGENALLDCCSMAIGKVESAIAAHHGSTKKEAREFMGHKIGNVILTAPGKPKVSKGVKVVEIHAPKEIAGGADE
jgi:hypothetical protein